MEKIKVLKKDIVNGNGNCGLSCAIALAVRRAFKTKNVFVIAYDEDNDDELRIVVEKTLYKIMGKDNYNKVTDFISDFDMGVDVKPIEFYIEETQH